MPKKEVKILSSQDVVSLQLGEIEALYDAEGNGFVLQLEKKPTFLGMGQGLVPTLSRGEPLNAAALKGLRAELEDVYRTWLCKSVVPNFQKMIPDVDKITNTLLMESARAFRKQFTNALSNQGKKTLEDLLHDFFERIGVLWAETRQDDSKITVEESRLLPRNVRLMWSVKNARMPIELYCLEFPPRVHTISLFGKERRLAFPWMVVFALFEEKNLESSHFFYRPSPITSHENALFFPNLPHIFKRWPYSWCLGTSQPSITTEDADWDVKLLDYFWNSHFIYEERGDTLSYWYYKYAKTVPELNDDSWEKLSRETPEKITSLPWIPTGESIGEFARGIMEQSVVGNNKKYKKQQVALDAAKDEMLNRFREKLEEELFFLGSSLHFSQDAKKKCSDIVNAHLNRMNDKNLKILTRLARGAGGKMRNIFTGAPKGKEASHVPHLD